MKNDMIILSLMVFKGQHFSNNIFCDCLVTSFDFCLDHAKVTQLVQLLQKETDN